MQSEPVIRPAKPEDLAATGELIESSGLPVQGVDAHGGFVVAEIDSRIVGVAGVELYYPFALLRSVVVSEDLRGTGLGRALVVDRLRWAADLDVAGLYLLTIGAVDYFSSFGFREVSRDEVPPKVRGSAEFTGLCPDTAIAMFRGVKARPRASVVASSC